MDGFLSASASRGSTFSAGAHASPAGFRPRPPRALYIHVPFCVSICPYCDFVVYAGRDARGPASRIDALVAALHAELDLRADILDRAFGKRRAALTSVYLGGGTPSLLGPRRVAGLLDHVDARMGIVSGAEVTLETNPGAADRGDMRGYRNVGIDRVSIGAQSMEATELRRLGRRHSPADVSVTVAEARDARMRSISVDLLYDVPGQSLVSWQATLAATIALDSDHISTYAVSLEDPDAEGLTGALGDHLPMTRGAAKWRRRAKAEQDEDRAADMYELATDQLERHGYRGYELSNWARPGQECRHNLAYWRREPHEALGPGAHAFDGGVTRRWNAARLELYLAALCPPPGSEPVLPPGDSEQLTFSQARVETTVLGLRLSDGIDDALARAAAIGPGLSWAQEVGLVQRSRRRWRLTSKGRLLSNEVAARLVPARSVSPPPAPVQ